MTSHELARALLALPDRKVYKTTPEGLCRVIEASEVILDIWETGMSYERAQVVFDPDIEPEEDETRINAIQI